MSLDPTRKPRPWRAITAAARAACHFLVAVA
jgi:hypothetical protein